MNDGKTLHFRIVCHQHLTKNPWVRFPDALSLPIFLFIHQTGPFYRWHTHARAIFLSFPSLPFITLVLSTERDNEMMKHTYTNIHAYKIRRTQKARWLSSLSDSSVSSLSEESLSDFFFPGVTVGSNLNLPASRLWCIIRYVSCRAETNEPKESNL